jgi:hypothetical protein
MFCSHGGNKYFPGWEHLAQNKARFSVNKAALWISDDIQRPFLEQSKRAAVISGSLCV